MDIEQLLVLLELVIVLFCDRNLWSNYFLVFFLVFVSMIVNYDSNEITWLILSLTARIWFFFSHLQTRSISLWKALKCCTLCALLCIGYLCFTIIKKSQFLYVSICPIATFSESMCEFGFFAVQVLLYWWIQ